MSIRILESRFLNIFLQFQKYFDLENLLADVTTSETQMILATDGDLILQFNSMIPVFSHNLLHWKSTFQKIWTWFPWFQKNAKLIVLLLMSAERRRGGRKNAGAWATEVQKKSNISVKPEKWKEILVNSESLGFNQSFASKFWIINAVWEI